MVVNTSFTPNRPCIRHLRTKGGSQPSFSGANWKSKCIYAANFIWILSQLLHCLCCVEWWIHEERPALISLEFDVSMPFRPSIALLVSIIRILTQFIYSIEFSVSLMISIDNYYWYFTNLYPWPSPTPLVPIVQIGILWLARGL